MKRLAVLFLGLLLCLSHVQARAVQQLIKSGTTESIPVFVCDSTGAPVTGIASNAFTITVRKPNTGAYIAALGSIAESGNGVYDYTPTSAETTIAASKNMLLVHVQVTATATSFGDSAAQIVAFDPTDAAALGLSRLDVATSTRLATSGYTAPANPTDYARNNVAPGWYTAPVDPFGLSKGSYTTGTWGAFLNTQLDAAVSTRMATFGLPSNFSNLLISGGGAVTVGTNSDKSGYSLTQAFPANFSGLSIDGSGKVALTAGEHTALQSEITTALLNATVNGRTVKSIFAANGSSLLGTIQSYSRNTVAKTITIVYVDGGMTITYVQSYSDTALTLPTGRTVSVTGGP